MADNQSVTALVRTEVATEPLPVQAIFLQWVDLLTKYLWIAPVTTGLPRNALSIMVALKKENRRVSTCVYIVGLATMDFLKLIDSARGYIIIHWEAEAPSEVHGQSVWYLSYSTGICSGLVLMEMSLDRLLAVKYPMSAKTICTTSKAIKTISATYVVVFVVNIHIFWAYRLSGDAGDRVLSVSIPGYQALETLVLAYQLGVGSFLPFLVIVYCNLQIIITLRQAAGRRGQLGVGSHDQKVQEKETTHLTRMMILVCLAYVLTSLPYRMYELFMKIPQLIEMYNMDVPYWELRFLLQYYVIIHFWEWNYAINFYLYCIGGGRKYRNDVKKLLCRCKQIKSK